MSRADPLPMVHLRYPDASATAEEAEPMNISYLTRTYNDKDSSITRIGNGNRSNEETKEPHSTSIMDSGYDTGYETEGPPTKLSSDSCQVTYRNLTFTVKVKDPNSKKGMIDKVILKAVSGTFKPGRLTAIMGASGAGKTSLLNCLAGYANTGVTNGEILINSESVSIPQIKRISAYVHQDDIIMDTQTVKEAITLAARLKLPESTPMADRLARVDEIIRILHLTKAQDSMIGNERIKGISGGERRRTSLGMQMVTNPNVLFLDEPTSGLDTFTAYSVCKILKSVANKHGKTVVATIHQPSSDIYHMFDDLVLMAGGQIVYHGPAKHAMPYFSQRGFPCPQHHNPADHFFNAILHDKAPEPDTFASDEGSEFSPLVGSSVGLLTNQEKTASSAQEHDRRDAERHEWLIKQWNESSESKELQVSVNNTPAGGLPAASTSGMASFTTQFQVLIERAAKNMARNPLILKARVGQTVIFAVVVGLIYLQVNNDQASIQNRLGALFFVAVQMLFGGSMSIMTIFGAEKKVFLRDYAAGMYQTPAYFISRTAVELPGKFFFPFLFGTITYWMIGFQKDGEKYVLYFLTLVLMDNVGGSLGLFLATLFPDIRVAMAIMPLILLPLMIFSGFFINNNNYPPYFGWISYISPMRYGFIGLAKGEFEGLHLYCSADQVKNNTCIDRGEQELHLLGFDSQPSQGLEMLIMFALFVGFLSLSYIALWNSARKVTATVKQVHTGNS